MPDLLHLVRQSDIDRFWSKVQKPDDLFVGRGCWNWIGSKTSGGYGVFSCSKSLLKGRKNNSMKAHRFVYLAYKGEIPYGKVICHTCDNPSCVNPLHLFISTQSGNIKDAINKYRLIPIKGLKGEKHNQAKLTDKEISEMRELYSTNKYSFKDIAEKYPKCGVDHIRRILQNKQRLAIQNN